MFVSNSLILFLSFSQFQYIEVQDQYVWIHKRYVDSIFFYTKSPYPFFLLQNFFFIVYFFVLYFFGPVHRILFVLFYSFVVDIKEEKETKVNKKK